MGGVLVEPREMGLHRHSLGWAPRAEAMLESNGSLLVFGGWDADKAAVTASKARGAGLLAHSMCGVTTLPAGGWGCRPTAGGSRRAKVQVSFTVNEGVRIMKNNL